MADGGAKLGERLAGRAGARGARVTARRTPAIPGAALAIAAFAGIALTLSGCAPAAPDPEPTASESAPAPDITDGGATGEAETPSEAGESVVIPGCDEIIPLAQVQAKLGANFEPWEGPEDTGHLTASLGPSAVTAFEAATAVQPCYWGVPLSDHTTNLFVAKLPTASRVALVDDLRSSDYVETESQGITLFHHTVNDGVMEQTNWFGFEGDVWVASTHYGEQLPVELAFAGVRAANPDWRPGTV